MDYILIGIFLDFKVLREWNPDKELEKYHIQKVGLLGTKYTMTQDFYFPQII